MLGNETAAMKKTYCYGTNTETVWLSYRLLYYILCNTTWTAEGFAAERRTISPNNLPCSWAGGGGGIQYKSAVSKLHC